MRIQRIYFDACSLFEFYVKLEIEPFFEPMISRRGVFHIALNVKEYGLYDLVDFL